MLGLRKIQDCKVWVWISIRLLTKAVNLQVLEGKSVDAVNRLGYEDEMPSLILIDR